MPGPTSPPPAKPVQTCPPGHQCPKGAVSPTACKAGFFADQKQPSCRECPQGTFQDRTGQRACKTCPLGAFCAATKMTTPTLCPVGTFGAKLKAVSRDSCVQCPINVSPLTALSAWLSASLFKACLPACPPARLPAQIGPAPSRSFNRLTCHHLAVLQTFTSTRGQSRCTRCLTGQWTGRLTGQSLCWPTSQKLPTSRPLSGK